MITTRFAPSPTGRLHLGHAFSAVLGHQRARQSHGRFLLRIEDLDPGRARDEFVDAMVEDLSWLGIAWDEPTLVQSRRTAAYVSAVAQLRDEGLAYACFCTRADIAAALTAPHGANRPHYPGKCRALPDDPQRRAVESHCWRLDSAKGLARTGAICWSENGQAVRARPGDFDDIILARKDAPASYHLACVIDDAATAVTLVTRGCDLGASTPVQRLLQNLLDLPQPGYFHHPLVAHADGRRLAKRDLAPTLAAMRQDGVDGRALASSLRAGELPLGFAFRDD